MSKINRFLLSDWDVNSYKLRQHLNVVIESYFLKLSKANNFRNSIRILLPTINEPLCKSNYLFCGTFLVFGGWTVFVLISFLRLFLFWSLSE